MKTGNEKPQSEMVVSERAYEIQVERELNLQLSAARKFQRTPTKSIEAVKELIAMQPDLAEDYLYRYERGGKPITGPSVRLAELIASCWGNLRIQSKVIEIGTTEVTCQAICHDLESNVAISCDVRRKITDSRGRRYSLDMINTTANAGSSIAMRNAILKAVPKAFWSEAYKAVLEQKGETLNGQKIEPVQSESQVEEDVVRNEIWQGICELSREIPDQDKERVCMEVIKKNKPEKSLPVDKLREILKGFDNAR